jgi:hypothetical protein
MSGGISPASVEAGTADVMPSAGNPRAAARARQGRLWRALGGMLLALALGVTVVMMEIHAQLRIHAARVHQRLTLEQSKVIQLQQAVASANRAIAVEDSALIAQEKFNEILLTPDTRLIHFEKGTPTLLGIIVINQRLKVAAVEISGAKMANQVAELWWMPRQGEPIASDKLRFDNRGKATTFVNLMPFFSHIKSVVVLLQSQAYDGDQATKMLLKADLSSAIDSH